MPTKFSNNRYSAEFKSSIMSLHKIGRSANSLYKEYNVSVLSGSIRLIPITPKSFQTMNEP